MSLHHGGPLLVHHSLGAAWQGERELCIVTLAWNTRDAASWVQAMYCIVAKKYNQFLAQLLVVYMMSLLALFGHFYVTKYSRPSKASMKIKMAGHGHTSKDNVLDGEVSPDAGKIKSG